MNKKVKYYMKGICIDCSQKCTYDAKRCKKCSAKENGKQLSGRNNPNFQFDLKEEDLRKKYLKQRQSLGVIGNFFNCSIDTVRRYLIKYHIPRRKFGEGKKGKKILNPYNRKDFKGKNNPFFGKHHTQKTKRIVSKKNRGRIRPLKERIQLSLSHGGTGIPREFNKYPINFFRIRKVILKRDNYICKYCLKKGKVVHHIDYDKTNCNEDNLISLCQGCNIRANFNRDYWYSYFKYMIEELIYA